MFDELFGLPAHPLLVHLPVVLVPGTTLVAVLYALVPRLRSRVDALLVPLALAAPAVTWPATESGEAFAARLGGQTPEISRHSDFGERLLYVSLAVAVLAVAAVVVDRRRLTAARAGARAEGPGAAVAAPPGTRGLALASMVLSALLLIAAVGATVYAVYAGHSGAAMVWGND